MNKILIDKSEYEKLVKHKDTSKQAMKKYLSSDKGKLKNREASHRRYHKDVETSRSKARDYYSKNREKILARRKEKRESKE